MIKKLPNKIAFGIGGLLVFMIIASAIFRVLTPQSPPIETVITSNQQFAPEYTFSNIDVAIPDQMSVYLSQDSVSLTQSASSLADVLRLESVSGLENYWQNIDGQKLLYLENQNSLITFSDSSLIDAVDTAQPISLDQVKFSVQEFMKNIGLTNNMSFIEAKRILITPSRFMDVEKESDANGYEFALTHVVDTFPYYSATYKNLPATVWVTQAGQVVKISFYPQTPPTEKVGTHDTLSLEQIQSNIQAGFVTFISVENTEVFEPTAQNLQKADFTSAQIEFRKNDLNGYVLPYLRFSGIGTDDLGRTYEIDAITPAVKVE